MNPISNQKFSDDYHKFVLQNPNVWEVNYNVNAKPSKPFSLESKKTEKPKKDLKKDDEKKDSKEKR